MVSPDKPKADFLEEYINPKRTKGKYILFFIALIVFLFLIYLLVGASKKRLSIEQLKASIELSNIDSIWIEKGKIDDGESEKIILVPTISFKIRNIGVKEIKYLSIVGVFRFHGTEKFLGEGNKMVLKDSLKSGAISDKIVTIVSDRGYRATSVNAFIDNSKEWQRTFVDVFAKLGGYKHVKIKRFNISRRIKGMNLNIKITKPESIDG